MLRGGCTVVDNREQVNALCHLDAGSTALGMPVASTRAAQQLERGHRYGHGHTKYAQTSIETYPLGSLAGLSATRCCTASHPACHSSRCRAVSKKGGYNSNARWSRRMLGDTCNCTSNGIPSPGMGQRLAYRHGHASLLAGGNHPKNQPATLALHRHLLCDVAHGQTMHKSQHFRKAWAR